MKRDENEVEPTQTTPKGARIPVPTREAFLRDMAKVAPPVEREPDDVPQDNDDSR